MQGDIFQLESLAPQVTVPKPQPAMARSRPATGEQVAIYNEDDLSHLLYVSNNPRHNHHHHPHHHHHNHTHEQKPFTHPADARTVLINAVVDDMEADTPALSDCESCYGSETSGVYVESPVTPPLSSFEIDDEALEAYRRKGRRNAFAVDSEFDFGFPVFLGRQDEEYPINPPRELAPLDVASRAMAAKTAETEEVPLSQHVNAIRGPTMSWWPEPLETMEHDWTTEKTEWQLRLEKENLKDSLMERERKDGVMSNKTYGVAPVSDIEGRIMSWWPAPADGMEYEWCERFYE
ncbi:hypothetical protein ANO14919_095110 [Xylariales sp. No.14919]|nr:hypothetical protein F5X98DRAFT_169735 [Xylaria grammica]GAW20017.1 hypothetical protein ANO14919_095110 [Xylariales sp. No.14919]